MFVAFHKKYKVKVLSRYADDLIDSIGLSTTLHPKSKYNDLESMFADWEIYHIGLDWFTLVQKVKEPDEYGTGLYIFQMLFGLDALKILYRYFKEP